MSDQGAVIITMAIPASTARGSMLSGAGTLSATLRAVGCVVEGTDATETRGAVQIGGTALALCGGTIAIGGLATANADGKLIAHVEDTDAVDGTDHLACAVMLEAGADGELRRVKLL
jgi:hypothetical protein